VFAGPVDATEKMTETGPNATGCNRTIGCGCLLWAPGWVAGCRTFKIFENRAKTGCNPLQPVFYVHTRQRRYLDHIYLFYLLIIRRTPSLQTRVGHFFQAPTQLPSNHRHIITSIRFVLTRFTFHALEQRTPSLNQYLLLIS
jgi:hypothetical protein